MACVANTEPKDDWPVEPVLSQTLVDEDDIRVPQIRFLHLGGREEEVLEIGVTSIVLKVKEVLAILLQQFDQVAVVVILENLRLLLSHVGFSCPGALKVDDLIYRVLEPEFLVNQLF